MKKTPILLSVLLLSVLFSGCDPIEGVFKGGLIIGIIIAAIVIGLIAWLTMKAFNRSLAE